MTKKTFIILLLTITLIGLTLRLHNYTSIPPFTETQDEFIYPWAGISFIKTGVPSTWSPFSSKNIEVKHFWGKEYRIVSPWIEKPPLYALIVGLFALLNGQTEFNQIRLSTIRLLPIMFTTISVVLLGLLTMKLINTKTALLSVLIYSSTPIMVMSSRLSLTENLLIPLLIGTLLIYSYRDEFKTSASWLMGIGCVLAVLTKQTGVALPLAITGLLVWERQWKDFLIVALLSGLGLLIHPFIGWFYDWKLFIAIAGELQRAHALGLPEAMFILFKHIGIGHKESFFLDGTLLAGYILFFAAPFIQKQNKSWSTLLVFPFTYITLVVIGQGGTTWYGWHLFPLYPFLAAVLAKAVVDLINHPQILQSLFFLITIGASSLRFMIKFFPDLETDWPLILGLVVVISVGILLIRKKRLSQITLISLLLTYFAINIYTVFNLSQIYPSLPQPAF